MRPICQICRGFGGVLKEHDLVPTACPVCEGAGTVENNVAIRLVMSMLSQRVATGDWIVAAISYGLRKHLDDLKVQGLEPMNATLQTVAWCEWHLRGGSGEEPGLPGEE